MRSLKYVFVVVTKSEKRKRSRVFRVYLEGARRRECNSGETRRKCEVQNVLWPYLYGAGMWTLVEYYVL